jgi:hypothetical protein
MSKITRCPRCGGNIVEPAYDGDGAYPVAPMCTCQQHDTPESVAEKARRARSVGDQFRSIFGKD